MEVLQMPQALRRRGFTDWPKIMILKPGEPLPEPGIPYIRTNMVYESLIFRLLVPSLQKKHPYFDWETVYHEMTGHRWRPAPIYRQTESAPYKGDGDNSEAYNPLLDTDGEIETMTLEEMASDTASGVDLDVLLDMKLIPAFWQELAEAVRINVTNNFAWHDGYNKKTKLCTGYLTEQARKKSLVILDISWSIPEGVSAGMLTLIQTITEITHADLILTGGKSYFFTNDEVKSMDIKEWRRKIPRANESIMFNDILKNQITADYDIVIAFGDSDYPGEITLPYKIHTKKLYSYYSKRYYRYVDPDLIAGYGRWVVENNPDVEVITNTNWAHYFK